MKNAAKVRSISRVVDTSPGCAPLKEAYRQSLGAKPKSWSQVETIFLRGMEAFDQNVADGTAVMGDLQNGKGDFFNDVLALILENCAGVTLYSRASVPGLIFPKHNLDVTFPNSGTVEFTLEAKAVGTPRHPGSPKAKALGRAGSADLDKRIKEIGFKAIDLKAEYARLAAEKGESPKTIAGDLTTWLRSVRPKSYLFFACRVVSDRDRDRVFRMADVASMVTDAVGVYCYRPLSAGEPTRYRAEVVPSHLQLDRALFRACQDLSAINASEQGRE